MIQTKCNINVTLFVFWIKEDEDSTPPPKKKPRKSSSSDSDFYDTQSANKTNESKPDEQIASTSLETPPPKGDANDAGTSKSEQVEIEDHPQQDDEIMGKNEAVEQRHKITLPTSPISFSNSSSVSTGSSPETNSLPINTSNEHERSFEKNVEQKLLRKIEYHLMDIFQHLEEAFETADLETGSIRHTANQSKIISTSDISNTSGSITTTSHKIQSISSVAEDDNPNEPGPSQ